MTSLPLGVTQPDTRSILRVDQGSLSLELVGDFSSDDFIRFKAHVLTVCYRAIKDNCLLIAIHAGKKKGDPWHLGDFTTHKHADDSSIQILRIDESMRLNVAICSLDGNSITGSIEIPAWFANGLITAIKQHRQVAWDSESYQYELDKHLNKLTQAAYNGTGSSAGALAVRNINQKIKVMPEWNQTKHCNC